MTRVVMVDGEPVETLSGTPNNIVRTPMPNLTTLYEDKVL
jgi:hypothetical protein